MRLAYHIFVALAVTGLLCEATSPDLPNDGARPSNLNPTPNDSGPLTEEEWKKATFRFIDEIIPLKEKQEEEIRKATEKVDKANPEDRDAARKELVETIKKYNGLIADFQERAIALNSRKPDSQTEFPFEDFPIDWS